MIAPYVSALPAETKININTAPALVLASMDEKLDLNAVTDALQRKQSNMEYFNVTGDLWGLEPFDQISATNKAQVNPLLDIKSDFLKLKLKYGFQNVNGSSQHTLNAMKTRSMYIFEVLPHFRLHEL